MVAELLYKNAPLVEVIAELQWGLMPIVGGQIGAIDPFLEFLQRDFLSWASNTGYPFREKLVPGNVPREFLAHKPLVRVRPEARKWPIYQLGPGLFTCNVVPPYGGWSSFRPTIADGVAALFTHYPKATETLRFEKIELRYLDGFRRSHGVTKAGEFLRDQLQLAPRLPEALFADSADRAGDAVYSGEVSINLERPPKTTGRLAYAQGEVNGEPAVILDVAVTSKPESTPQTKEAILEWFDLAHGRVSAWFDALLSDELRARLDAEPQ